MHANLLWPQGLQLMGTVMEFDLRGTAVPVEMIMTIGASAVLLEPGQCSAEEIARLRNMLIVNESGVLTYN
jgi:hypothetical protein